MKRVLTDWFNEEIPQALVPERVLANMALTVLQPGHPYAYRKGSCWGRCAHAIAELQKTDQLHDGISIVFYGRDNSRAVHAILAENDLIELDIYYPDRHGKQNINDPYMHAGEILLLQKQISVAEFFKDYVSKVRLSNQSPRSARDLDSP